MPECPSLAERREARQLPLWPRMRNKANLGGTGGGQPDDGSCETKPISGRRQGQDGLATGTPHGVTTSEVAVRNKANSGRGLCRTAWGERTFTLLCETKPNAKRQAAGGQTTDRAKQSQTWEGWGIWGKANVACEAVPPEGRACETKPISERRQGRDGPATCAWPVVRNKAKCQETGSREKAAGGQMTNRAKQSQLPDRREVSPIMHGGLVGISGPDHVEGRLLVGMA